jgi:hypothetical protein
MNKKRWLIFGSIVITVLMVAVALLVNLFNQPLRPSLELIISAPFEPSPGPVMQTTAGVMQTLQP